MWLLWAVAGLTAAAGCVYASAASGHGVQINLDAFRRQSAVACEPLLPRPSACEFESVETPPPASSSMRSMRARAAPGPEAVTVVVVEPSRMSSQSLFAYI